MATAPALREVILAQVVALLQNNTPALDRVKRSRETTITKDGSPAITVRYGGEQCQRNGEALVIAMDVLVVIYVRGDPVDQLAAEIDAAAHRLLLADDTLGPAIERVGTMPEDEEADRTAGSLTVRYRVTFRTSRRDIARAPV